MVDALKAVRESEEVADLMAALKQHAGHSLQTLGERLLDSGDKRPGSVVDMLARVRALVQPADAASAGS